MNPITRMRRIALFFVDTPRSNAALFRRELPQVCPILQRQRRDPILAWGIAPGLSLHRGEGLKARSIVRVISVIMNRTFSPFHISFENLGRWLRLIWRRAFGPFAGLEYVNGRRYRETLVEDVTENRILYSEGIPVVVGLRGVKKSGKN